MVFINMSFEEIESWVQESLDECTSGMVQFRVKEIGEKEVRMFFIRNFLVTLIIVYDEKIGFWLQEWKSEYFKGQKLEAIPYCFHLILRKKVIYRYNSIYQVL